MVCEEGIDTKDTVACVNLLELFEVYIFLFLEGLSSSMLAIIFFRFLIKTLKLFIRVYLFYIYFVVAARSSMPTFTGCCAIVLFAVIFL